MKRLIVLLGLLLTFTIACSGGSEGATEESESTEKDDEELNVGNEDEAETTDKDEKTLDGLIDHFEAEGFEVGEESLKGAEIIGAIDGLGVELDGEEIEIYLYNSSSDDLEQIKTSEEYEMDGFDPFPALANDNLVLINHDEHSSGNEVIESFESY